MIKISKREQKYLEIAKTVPYTDEELKILKNLLSGYLFDERGFINERMWDIEGAVSDQIENGYTIDTINDRPENELTYYDEDREINLMQFLFINFRKIFLFLLLPLDEIPRYLGLKILEPFLEWRFKINK